MKSSFINTLGILLLSLAVSQAQAANDNELRIRCDSKRDVNACLEVGLSDAKLKDKVHHKSAQRELKKACAIQMNRACSKQETKSMALAYLANKNRIPANASRGSIRAPKIAAPGKRASTGGHAGVPAYEPPPMNEPPQPPMPAEAPYIPPPMPPMPPPPPVPAPGQCMPGDVSCMQGQTGMPMGQ